MDRFFKFSHQGHSNNNLFSADKIQELENNNLLSLDKKKQILLNGIASLKKTKNIKDYISCSLMLSDIYFEEKENSKIREIFCEVEGLIKEDHLKFHDFHRRYRAYLMKEGEVEEARALALRYTTILKKKKKYRRASLFISEMEKEVKLDKIFYQFWLESLGKEGDLNSFNEVYSKYKKKFLEIKFSLDPWYRELQEFWEDKKIQWEIYSEIYKNKLIIVSDKKIRTPLELSAFLNLYHGLLVLHNVEDDFINYIDNVINRSFRDLRIYEMEDDFFETKIENFENESKLEDRIIYKRPFKKNKFISKKLLNEEKLLLNFIEKKTELIFLKNLKEWLVCFIFMEAYLICDYLFLIYDKSHDFKGPDYKILIDIEYLRIETFLKRNVPKLALSRCELILKSIPLIDKERICFLYLMAEAYKNLNLKRKSMELFKVVNELNPQYRLVRERLIEFE